MIDGPTDLYRYFNHVGDLLYVGISIHAATRAMGHRDSAGWWQQWSRMEVERHPTRAAALEAERSAIINERPQHNIKHNSGERVPSTTAIEQEGLVGLFFHTPDEDTGFPLVEWQGRIVAEIGLGSFLIQLYSWWSGDPTNQQIATLDDMKAWRFYPTRAEWLDVGARAMRSRDRRDERLERTQ